MRRNLQRLENWDQWDAAFDAQLDDHNQAGVFGKPVLRSSLPTQQQSQICRFQWSNLVKASGKQKCCACLDGSPRSAPGYVMVLPPMLPVLSSLT